jgi:hypothetical protein
MKRPLLIAVHGRSLPRGKYFLLNALQRTFPTSRLSVSPQLLNVVSKIEILLGTLSFIKPGKPDDECDATWRARVVSWPPC